MMSIDYMQILPHFIRRLEYPGLLISTIARLIEKKRKKDQINKIGNEKVEITTDNAETQRL